MHNVQDEIETNSNAYNSFTGHPIYVAFFVRELTMYTTILYACVTMYVRLTNFKRFVRRNRDLWLFEYKEN